MAVRPQGWQRPRQPRQHVLHERGDAMPDAHAGAGVVLPRRRTPAVQTANQLAIVQRDIRDGRARVQGAGRRAAGGVAFRVRQEPSVDIQNFSQRSAGGRARVRSMPPRRHAREVRGRREAQAPEELPAGGNHVRVPGVRRAASVAGDVQDVRSQERHLRLVYGSIAGRRQS